MDEKLINETNNVKPERHPKFRLLSYILGEEYPTGVAYIFNNKFDGEKIRSGSDIDVNSLFDALPKLGFRTFLHENLDLKSCLNELEKIATTEIGKYHSLLIMFLSHGTADGVTMADYMNLTIKMITQYFKKKTADAIKDIPKIFLFQTCRGGLEDKTDQNSSGKPQLDDDYEQTELSTVLPSSSNFFQGFSCPPGYKSYLYKDEGSRFIQTFTTIINDWVMSGKETDTIDFVSLMTKVADEVAEMGDENWRFNLVENSGNEMPQGLCKKKNPKPIRLQMPWFSSTLKKQLELKKFPNKNKETNEIDTKLGKDSSKKSSKQSKTGKQ